MKRNRTKKLLFELNFGFCGSLVSLLYLELSSELIKRLVM